MKLSPRSPLSPDFLGRNWAFEENTVISGGSRAVRATIGAAALAVVLVTVLAIANWVFVRDHVEAWHFQFTRDTKMIQPLPEGMTRERYRTQEDLLQFAADRLRCPVIVDPRELTSFHVGRWRVPAEGIPETLDGEGWRVLEQRFPRRAYVLIRALDSIGQTAVLPQGIRWEDCPKGPRVILRP